MRQRVKCVTDAAGYAIYFSRSVIPGNKDGAVRPFPQPFAQQPHLLHLGLQCYDRRFLREYCRMAPTPLMVRLPIMHLQIERPLIDGVRLTYCLLASERVDPDCDSFWFAHLIICLTKARFD